jgi:CheY-like chemotaxis protein
MPTERRSDVLSAPPSGAHLLHFYGLGEELVEAVVRYFGEGLRRGEAAVVVATKAHADAFADGLRRTGLDPASAEWRGLWTAVDAPELLERILSDGRPDPIKFRALVGDLLDRAGRFGRVRVYGEMVDLLWRDGRLDAAFQLEDCWAAMLAGKSFTLFCAYEMSLLSPGLDDAALERVAASHTHGVGGLDRGRLERAVDQALAAELGPARAVALRRLIAATLRRTASLGRVEHTILWLRRNLPRSAEAILATARRLYAEPSQATEAEDVGEPPGAPQCVLYVEDDENDLFFVRHAFGKVAAGLRIEAVSHGQMARDYLAGEGPYADRAAHPWPTLVLMDLKLPRLSGLEVLAWMKTRPELAGLPVIILSSSTEKTDVSGAYALGANVYLSKVNLKALLETVPGIAAYVEALAETAPSPPAGLLAAPPDRCAGPGSCR